MSKTIAVFGAGPGLGRSVARRFGREGFRVALVARTPARLDALVEELGAEGIEAAGFPADLGDRAALPGLLDAITDRLGPIDVLEYAPAGPEWQQILRDVREVDVAALEFPLDLLLHSPVTLVHGVLPGMLDRGRGTVLFGLAATSVRPYPQAGNLGPAAAAARSYVHNLHASLAGTGVYAGLVQVGGLVRDSDAAAAVLATWQGEKPPAIDPADIAESCWQLHIERDRFEAVHEPRG